MRLSVVFALVVCATLAASAVALKEGECEGGHQIVNLCYASVLSARLGFRSLH